METGSQSDLRVKLPVIESMEQPARVVVNCEGCGVCCREQPVPPFLDEIDFVPAELQAEAIEALRNEVEIAKLGQPCIWFNETTHQCKHHEHRPNICREFVIGEELCLEIRVRWGVI